MEILFKDDIWYYYIEEDFIKSKYIEKYPNIDLTNIRHLNDIQPLYHYIVNQIDYANYDGYVIASLNYKRKIPVYYEHNGSIITKIHSDYYLLVSIRDDYIKDHTLINTKLLDNI